MQRLWNKLTLGQRLAVLVLAAAIAVSISWTFSVGPRVEYQRLLETALGEESQELRSFLGRLESEGIDWRPGPVADGRIAIEVPAGAEHQRALLLAAEHDLRFGETTSLDRGFFGSGGFADSVAGTQRRLDEARVRTVERAIRWYPDIESVHLVVQPARSGRFARDPDRPESAAVLLRLRPGVHRLAAREAATVRKLVSTAFTIPEERVQVVDNNMRDYPPGEVVEAFPRSDDVRRKVETVVEGLYLGSYRKDQFRIGVLVDSSPERDAAGSASASAGTEGDLPRVRVNVVFDIEAVQDLLRKRASVLGEREQDAKLLAERIEAYEREQESFLAQQLPMPDVKVTVGCEVFQGPAALPVPPVPSHRAAASRADLWSWLRIGILCATSGMSVILASWLILARRYVRRHDVTAAIAPASRRACEAVLGRASRASELARERPEVALSILRLWMSDAPIAVRGGLDRGAGATARGRLGDAAFGDASEGRGVFEVTASAR